MSEVTLYPTEGASGPVVRVCVLAGGAARFDVGKKCQPGHRHPVVFQAFGTIVARATTLTRISFLSPPGFEVGVGFMWV